MLGRRSTGKSSLLARYSETLGELSMRKRTELALLAAKIEADMASRAKSSFLGTMSHELRTPLNAIIGFSDLIQNMKTDNKAVETTIDYASHIAKAGRHLLDVVSDILDISKIESGTFELNIDTYPLAEILEDCVPLIKERVTAKSQILEVRLDPGLPHIPADARRLKQIVINLLANANKFTPDRGRILLMARRNADGGATIAVADTGIGMTPEEVAIALKPFGQVQSSRTRSYEGTGLGLSIASALARQHGGDLYIESEPGRGTSVILTLRATPPDRAAASPSVVASGGGERRVARKGAFAAMDGAP
jgi:two-component system, cell cycle sensor histidine kinase PleC